MKLFYVPEIYPFNFKHSDPSKILKNQYFQAIRFISLTLLNKFFVVIKIFQNTGCSFYCVMLSPAVASIECSAPLVVEIF